MQRAKAKFHAPGRWVAKGELFDDGDPFLKGREVLFEHVDVPAPQPKAEAEEPKAEEPKAEELKAEELKAEEPKVAEQKSAPRKTTAKKPAG